MTFELEYPAEFKFIYKTNLNLGYDRSFDALTRGKKSHARVP
jgi:hypothetical protein